MYREITTSKLEILTRQQVYRIHAKVVEAFDINNTPNEVYKHDFGYSLGTYLDCNYYLIIQIHGKCMAIISSMPTIHSTKFAEICWRSSCILLLENNWAYSIDIVPSNFFVCGEYSWGWVLYYSKLMTNFFDKIGFITQELI